MANYRYPPTQVGGPNYQSSSVYPFSTPYQQGSQFNTGERYQDYPLQSEEDSPRRNMKEDLFTTPPKSTFFDDSDEWRGVGVKAYRKGIQRQRLWTRGGGLFCFGRFFFCSILLIIYIIVAIILGLALWLRPPAVTFTNPGLNPNQQVNVGSTLDVPLELNITVWNPDFFSVDFKSLTAEVLYPDVTPTIAVGNGNLTNLIIKADQKTNFTFPIDISLDLTGSNSGDLNIVLDLAKKCGIIPQGPQSPIPLGVKIGIVLSVLGIKVTLPSISFTVSIGCPISSSEIQKKLQGILGGLGNL